MLEGNNISQAVPMLLQFKTFCLIWYGKPEKKKDDGRNSEAEKNWHCPFHLKQNELISETSNMNWFIIWKTDCKWELDKCSISFFFFQEKLGFAFLILVIIRLVILMTPKLAWRQPLCFHYTSYTNVKML